MTEWPTNEDRAGRAAHTVAFHANTGRGLRGWLTPRHTRTGETLRFYARNFDGNSADWPMVIGDLFADLAHLATTRVVHPFVLWPITPGHHRRARRIGGAHGLVSDMVRFAERCGISPGKAWLHGLAYFRAELIGEDTVKDSPENPHHPG